MPHFPEQNMESSIHSKKHFKVKNEILNDLIISIDKHLYFAQSEYPLHLLENKQSEDFVDGWTSGMNVLREWAERQRVHNDIILKLYEDDED